jgi:hypothetical protein
MPINFPTSPEIGTPYTLNGRRYFWDGVKWVGAGQPGQPIGVPIKYTSVSALISASEVDLAPGYYEVVGEWIMVYWDGVSFQYPTKATATHQQILTYYPTVEDI